MLGLYAACGQCQLLKNGAIRALRLQPTRCNLLICWPLTRTPRYLERISTLHALIEELFRRMRVRGRSPVQEVQQTRLSRSSAVAKICR